MLYLIFCYSLITFVCLWAGILVYSFLPNAVVKEKSVICFLITGLIGLTAFGQWIVLFIPLSLFPILLIILFLSLFTVVRRKFVFVTLGYCFGGLKNADRRLLICLFCFLVMILTLNAGPTMMDDTDSYHIQMVKWIQEYGSVPGIANLHLRFGFNSSWFVSIGLLTYPLHGLDSYLSLNGLLALWFCYYLLEKIFHFLRNNALNRSLNGALGCLLILILCLINWPMIRGCATSANYDFICTVCTVVLFIDMAGEEGPPPPEWFIWPLYLFTVRIINFPMLLFTFFYFLRIFKPFRIKQFLGYLGMAFFLVIPFLARNVILSGYAFFPIYQLDFFSFDWKADKSLLIRIDEYIRYFNRVNPGFRPIAETSRLHFPQWTGRWFTYLFPFDRLIVVLSFLGYLLILLRVRKNFSRLQKVFLLVMGVQLICWFFIAPDPRFVQGSLLFGIYMAIQAGPALSGNLKIVPDLSVGAVSVFVLIYSLNKLIFAGNYRNFIVPHRLPVPQVKTVIVDNIELHIPSRVLNNWNPRCYDVALPCLYSLDPRVEARGKAIDDGFRLKPGSLKDPWKGEYKIKEKDHGF